MSTWAGFLSDSPVAMFGVAALAVALVGAGTKYVRDLSRSRRFALRLLDWAATEGLTITRMRPVFRSQIPDELKRDPRWSTGIYVLKFAADDAEGHRRTGYLRFPIKEGRFAPPLMACWPETGPKFDDLT